MSYTALYRNFRPLKFADMVGQEHITKTLKNQITAGRVGHAYLFTGGRGTGKTTTAKILARVVNCLDSKDGEPCNKCEICKEILDGSLTDVVEMDAASNNSVEDIRQIRDEVNFLPTKAKYRVYIIDEVHMLSTGAFNALLKTLEEPPSHVKFILATTEPQKLPMTILSRCQRFDFKKISEQDIIKRLKIIAKESKITIDDSALQIIAVLSEGHMRDAISILERCSQESTESITIDEVKELVGLPKLEYINKLARAILEYDVNKSLEAINDVINSGKDLYNYLWEVIKYFKDILVYKTTNNLNLYSKTEIKEIEELSKLATEERLLNIIYKLSDLENDIKWSSQKTIMFQTGVIKICRKEVTEKADLGDLSQIIDEKISESLAKFDFKNVEAKSKTQNNATSNKNTIKESEVLVGKSSNQITEIEMQKTSKQVISEGNEGSIGSKQQEVGNNQLENLKNENEQLEKSRDGAVQKDKQIKDDSGRKNQSIDVMWKKLTDSLKKDGKIRLYTALINTKVVELNDMVWEIEFPNGLTAFNEKILGMPDNTNYLTKEIAKVSGREIHLRYKKDSSNKATTTKKPAIGDLGVDINIIDE